jgi:formiminotetrahydrofolate cyclodeaminase
MLVDRTLVDLLAAFESPDPTPGGGSAAAVASSVGTSLLMMVAGLPKTRSNSDEDRAKLAEARAALAALKQQLVAAVDADTTAYDEVVAAYKLPKASEQEQAVRKSAVQQAMRHATDVPLQVMRLSAEALQHAKSVAAHGHRPAASDAGVAIALLRAGLEGARLNVSVNLGSVTDAAYAERVRREAGQFHRDAEASAAAATPLLAEK